MRTSRYVSEYVSAHFCMREIVLLRVSLCTRVHIERALCMYPCLMQVESRKSSLIVSHTRHDTLCTRVHIERASPFVACVRVVCMFGFESQDFRTSTRQGIGQWKILTGDKQSHLCL